MFPERQESPIKWVAAKIFFSICNYIIGVKLKIKRIGTIIIWVNTRSFLPEFVSYHYWHFCFKCRPWFEKQDELFWLHFFPEKIKEVKDGFLNNLVKVQELTDSFYNFFWLFPIFYQTKKKVEKNSLHF